MKHQTLQPVFADTFPEPLEPGILYISTRYANVAHLCCCGCGEEVTTPLAPTEWSITFDGKTVSLSPSVGNWALACKSHYFVTRNQVRWAGAWTDEQVQAGRRRERAASQRYYDRRPAPPASPVSTEVATKAPAKESWLSKLWMRFVGGGPRG